MALSSMGLGYRGPRILGSCGLPWRGVGCSPGIPRSPRLTSAQQAEVGKMAKRLDSKPVVSNFLDTVLWDTVYSMDLAVEKAPDAFRIFLNEVREMVKRLDSKPVDSNSLNTVFRDTVYSMDLAVEKAPDAFLIFLKDWHIYQCMARSKGTTAYQKTTAYEEMREKYAYLAAVQMQEQYWDFRKSLDPYLSCDLSCGVVVHCLPQQVLDDWVQQSQLLFRDIQRIVALLPDSPVSPGVPARGGIQQKMALLGSSLFSVRPQWDLSNFLAMWERLGTVYGSLVPFISCWLKPAEGRSSSR